MEVCICMYTYLHIFIPYYQSNNQICNLFSIVTARRYKLKMPQALRLNYFIVTCHFLIVRL